MKFNNPFPIFISITILSITSIFSSCEVEHFYDAEITVMSSEGIPLSSMNVECVVDVNDGNLIDLPSAVTNSVGKVNFSFDNIAILKVKANSLDTNTSQLTGEALLVLEEDKKVKLTVVAY